MHRPRLQLTPRHRGADGGREGGRACRDRCRLRMLPGSSSRWCYPKYCALQITPSFQVLGPHLNNKRVRLASTHFFYFRQFIWDLKRKQKHTHTHTKYTESNSCQTHLLKTDHFQNQSEHSMVYSFGVRQIGSEP